MWAALCEPNVGAVWMSCDTNVMSEWCGCDELWCAWYEQDMGWCHVTVVCLDVGVVWVSHGVKWANTRVTSQFYISYQNHDHGTLISNNTTLHNITTYQTFITSHQFHISSYFHQIMSTPPAPRPYHGASHTYQVISLGYCHTISCLCDIISHLHHTTSHLYNIHIRLQHPTAQPHSIQPQNILYVVVDQALGKRALRNGKIWCFPPKFASFGLPEEDGCRQSE